MTTNLSPITTLLTCYANAHQRLFIVISGKRQPSNTLAKLIINTLSFVDTLSINTLISEFSDTINDTLAKSYLGQSTDALIYDAYEGFDPDAFGILSGTLRGGGLCLLICPPLEQWPECTDPVNHRLTVYGYEPEELSNFYLQRLARHIHNHCDPLALKHPSKLYTLPLQTFKTSYQPLLPTYDQAQLIKQIMRLNDSGKTHQSLLITADRGRGKSAAMGIAAATLQQQNPCLKIAITGPKRKSVETFYEHYKSTLSATQTPLSCPFFAPDALINDQPELDILFFDEAASVPLPLLESLACHYPKLVYSSTVFGYEGAGRGFALRFKEMLIHQQQHHIQHLTLETPIRYAKNDPLEALTNKLLLLNATIPSIGSLTTTSKDKLLFTALERETLAHDETQLSALFALFVQAHYQTKALDLRHILDGPNLSIYTLKHGTHIIAAALIATEGQIADRELQEHIIHGKRRPRGHLLAQVLAYQHMQREYLELKSARIVRIVVSPEYQYKGYGSLLLEQLEQYLEQHNYDAMGASYGETTRLNRFWSHNGFTTLHQGHRRNASSGMSSVVVFRAISNTAAVAQQQSQQRRHRMTQSLSQMSFSKRELDEVKSYALHQRDYEASEATLRRFFTQHGSIAACDKATVVHDKLFQELSWKEIASKHKLHGRKAIEILIKDECRNILMHLR